MEGLHRPSLVMHHREIRSERRERLTVAFGCGGFLTAFLADGTLAGGRFLHLGAHGEQIVACRDDGEKNNQHASQGQQYLERCKTATVLRRS